MIIFNYLKDINRLKNWSPTTKLSSQYFSFFEKLYTYYQNFYSHLLSQKNIEGLKWTFLKLDAEKHRSTGYPTLYHGLRNYYKYYQEFEKLSLNTALFYSNSTDRILNVLEKTGIQTSDGFDIYRRIPINNGTLNYSGLELEVTYNPSNKIRLYGLLSPYFSQLSETRDNAYDYDNWVLYGNFRILYRINNTLRFISEQKAIADKYGVKLMAYEGGQGLVDFKTKHDMEMPNPILYQANRHPRMEQFYNQFLQGWRKAGGTLFAHYSGVPKQYGLIVSPK